MGLQGRQRPPGIGIGILVVDRDGERGAQVAAVPDAVRTAHFASPVNPFRRHAIGAVGLRFVAQPGTEPDRRSEGRRRVQVGEQAKSGAYISYSRRFMSASFPNKHKEALV